LAAQFSPWPFSTLYRRDATSPVLRPARWGDDMSVISTVADTRPDGHRRGTLRPLRVGVETTDTHEVVVARDLDQLGVRNVLGQVPACGSSAKRGSMAAARPARNDGTSVRCAG
jgi:hypothetical protein